MVTKLKKQMTTLSTLQNGLWMSFRRLQLLVLSWLIPSQFVCAFTEHIHLILEFPCSKVRP